MIVGLKAFKRQLIHKYNSTIKLLVTNVKDKEALDIFFSIVSSSKSTGYIGA